MHHRYWLTGARSENRNMNSGAVIEPESERLISRKQSVLAGIKFPENVTRAPTRKTTDVR
jgi:hypothetical protein